MKTRTVSNTVLLILLFLGLGPLLLLFIEALWHGGETFGQLLHSSSMHVSFQHTLLLSLGVAAAGTIAGTAVGILIGKTDLPLRKLFFALLILPLLLPPYLLALGWINSIGPSPFLHTMLFGFVGTFWVLFSVYLAIPILLTLLYLRQIDPGYEEAAAFFTNERGILLGILLPLLRPAMGLSFLLVFMLSFGEYSVANTLRYTIFPLEIFTRFSAFYDFDAAVVMSLPLLLLPIMAVAVEKQWLDRTLYRQSAYYAPRTLLLSSFQKSIFVALLTLLAATTAILPLLGLIVQIDAWQNFSDALALGASPLLHSIVFALCSALLFGGIGFLCGYVLVFRRVWLAPLLDTALLLLLLLPPTVVGIALIAFWNVPFLDMVYATPLLLVMGVVLKYLYLPTKIIQKRLQHLSSSLFEAAELLGAGPGALLRFIIVPLTLKALALAFVIGYLFSLRDSTISMLLYPPGFETLPVYILTHSANGAAGVIASLCVILIAATLLPLMIMLPLWLKRKTA